MIYYNPLDEACKSRIGAIPCDSPITFRLYSNLGGEANFSAEACTLLLNRDDHDPIGYPMTRTEDGWTITLEIHEIGLYFYCFAVGDGYIGCGARREGTYTQTPVCWQLTVYDEYYSTPEWFRGGIMYQIFPDRFRKSGEYPLAQNKIMRKWGELPNFRPNEQGEVLNNDFFGGNFNGVREKLDYLKSLGVTVIYFNPVFEAYSNHRYDTGDYLKIDSLLGTEEDFDLLVKEAAKKGIRIILDGVFNHTGADSVYFNRYGRYPSVGAYQSQESPYADWFQFHPFPDEYDSWWGIKTLPAVNEQSPSYQEFLFGEDGVIKHWLRRGIGGYRLDVVDELPDFFVKKLRKAVKDENHDAVIIGEVWEDASNKVAYGVRREYFQGAELDSVMNYPLKDAIISYVISGNTEMLRSTIAMLIDNYPEATLHSLMNVLDTHDTPRILTILGRKFCSTKEEMAQTWLTAEERENAKALLKFAAVLQYTLPGVPCLYYGDENGMEGYLDPFCRRCFDWENVDENLNAFYRRLGEIRGKELCAAFQSGAYREIYADVNCLVYERKSREVTAYVFVNRSDSEYKISFKGKYREYLSGEVFTDRLCIKPHSYGILSKA